MSMRQGWQAVESEHYKGAQKILHERDEEERGYESACHEVCCYRFYYAHASL